MAQRTTFAEALTETRAQRRHLLLGNGFSIAAHSGFHYGSLADEARNNDANIDRLFEAFGTNNFEEAMAAAVDPAQRQALRQAFFSTIASVHPERHQILRLAQRETCENFLAISCGRETASIADGYSRPTTTSCSTGWSSNTNDS